MKSGSISVLNSTSAVIGAAVVDATAPVMRLGNVLDAAIGGDPNVVNLFVVNPQTGKVVVLLDANRVAVLAAIAGAANHDTTGKYVATGDSKAKLWLQEGGTIVPGSVEDAGQFSALDAALSAPVRPVLTLSAAVSKVEDAMVNVDSPLPVLITVSQTDGAMYVDSFENPESAVTAYAAAIAASAKQAEFLCTPPAPAGSSSREFFA